MPKLLCPSCKSNAYSKILLEDGKYHILCLMHPSWGKPLEGTKVTAFGCVDCGFIGLYNLDIYQSDKPHKRA
jgi:hypothetical protein